MTIQHRVWHLLAMPEILIVISLFCAISPHRMELKEAFMAKKGSEVTGKAAGTAASKVLSNPSSTKAEKSAAASALTQRPTKKK